MKKTGEIAILASFVILVVLTIIIWNRPSPTNTTDEGASTAVNSESTQDNENNNTPISDNNSTVDKHLDTVVMFHNGTGPMCLEAMVFFEDNGIEYEEHLTSEIDFATNLAEYKEAYDNQSDGLSSDFGYYPMIFIGEKAYSGFNEDIGEEILDLL